MAPIALLSVSDKTGLVPFAKALNQKHGFQLVSSGGTAKELEKAGLSVTKVSDYTGAPEILNGRVKTLHPRIHGGILAKRNDSTHDAEMEQQGINHIDVVVVNLYPFESTIATPNVSEENAIENIDIGGPAMVRAAAKNYSHVSVLTSPQQYDKFLTSLDGANEISEATRKQLALEAFEHTASYDIAISRWLNKKVNSQDSPHLEAIPLRQNLRYGENPHQSAQWFSRDKTGWGGAKKLQGKELSTNNLLDLEAAFSTVYEFGYGNKGTRPASTPAAVVVKHTNPCGVALGSTIDSALKLALDADRTSAFGGIVALNTELNNSAANQLKELFLECIVAPSFTEGALEILSSKKNLRLLELSVDSIERCDMKNLRSVLGGVLVQEKDHELIDVNKWEVVTKRKPTSKEKDDMIFAWQIVRHVHSNAIAIALNGQSIGIGAGQMNRVGAAKIALSYAGKNAKDAVLASDGFFPFDDTVRLAASKGIKAIIQPGGSIRDKESIKACNELGLTMMTTGRRHFLH